MNRHRSASLRAIAIAIFVLILTSLACGRGSQVVPQAPTATQQQVPQASPVTQQQVPQAVESPALNLPVDNGIILFQDDFQDGQAQEWETNGPWYVEQNGDLYYFAASGRGRAWVPGGHSWSNYIFQAGVRLETGVLFLSMNLTREARYLLRMDQYGMYLIKEQPAGNVAILAQTGPLTMSTGHSVALAAQSGHLQVYVDGALWMDYTDTAPITSGTIGVSSLDGSRVGVDNIFVTQFSGPLPSGVVQAPPIVAQETVTVEQIQQEVAQAPIQQVEVVEEPEPEEPAPGALPDLAVTGVSWSPDPVIQSQPFQVTLQITNQGQAAAGAFTARLHYHAATGVPDCNADFPSLAPGENGMAFCTSVTNANPGTSPTEFTVDVEGEIAESNEENNSSAPTFTVVATAQDSGGESQPENNGGLPDLVATDFAFSPDPVVQGQPFDVLYYVFNQGNAAAGPFTIRTHFHAATGLADCNEDVPGLAPGENHLATCRRTTNAQPGTSPVEVTIDVENEIAESNEQNNRQTPTLTVVQVAQDGGGESQAALPDLVITDISFNPDPAVQGQPFAALVTVSNQGDGDAGIFTVRLHFHPNTGIPDCNWDVNGLGAGGSTRLDCTQMTNAQPGGYRTDLTLDVEGEITETNEGNNASNQPLQVEAP